MKLNLLAKGVGYHKATISGGLPDHLIKEVADQWWWPNGSPRTRALTQSIIKTTMHERGLPLKQAAWLVEAAMLIYQHDRTADDHRKYWETVEKLRTTEILPDDSRYQAAIEAIK